MAALLDVHFARSDDPGRRIAAALRDPAITGAHAPDVLVTSLRHLIDAGLDRLPAPGDGATLTRWRALASVARHDLALVKLFESHVDALAILREIDGGHAIRPGSIHAVWASEARVDPVTIRDATDDAVRVDGRKSWCSGATVVTSR